MDPTLKIHQYVIEDVTDDRYFKQVPKVDRCQTCHTFIDQPGYEDQENPYKTHPNLNTLAVGRKSAHPAKQFGCTSCHNGEGHKVFDFNSPEHTPQNEEQKKEWIAKYNWREPHKVLSPMLPLNHTEASCVKCHKEEWHYGGGTQVNKGKQLVKTYGCYGCHVIPGFKEQPKPGPSLHKISGKVSKEWIKNWIWSPHTFNPYSKMPAYFNQVNNRKPEFMMKNVAEVNAMAEYIYTKSKDFKPLAKFTGGNADQGKELIQTVGCIGCHQVEGIDEPYNKVKSRAGAYLTGTGSKVDPDWLVSWLIKPSHYQENTIMPSFRLSPKEANDIAAYLMTLKNKKFAKLKFNELDTEIRDGLLIDYFSAFEPKSVARKQLAKMDDHARTMELGKRSIGKYGCYSCHDIPGFAPDRAPIGPNLEAEGSKPLTQFGYGQQHDVVGHSRHEWIYAHLKEPARWDIGVPKAFGDLNKMPNFYLTDEEAEAITTYIIGHVDDKIPLKGQKILNEREKVAEIGKKIVAKYNCQGCHKIDGVGGTIAAAYEDDLNAGPPWLVAEGHRVKTDWLYDFLKQVHPIRPYLNVRMPSFHYTNDELNKIVNYFRADSEQPIFQEPVKVTWEPGERAAAVKIWNELACTSCHTGGFVKEEALAPNLHFAKKRLRPSWMKKWFKNPYAIMPYTVMPNFWENGTISAVEGVLDDDPQRQIQAITKYVLEFGYDRSPKPFPYQDNELRDEKDSVQSGLSSMEK